jgi:hypothetical protein
VVPAFVLPEQLALTVQLEQLALLVTVKQAEGVTAQPAVVATRKAKST